MLLVMTSLALLICHTNQVTVSYTHRQDESIKVNRRFHIDSTPVLDCDAVDESSRVGRVNQTGGHRLVLYTLENYV